MRSSRLKQILTSLIILSVSFGAIGCTEKNTVSEDNSNIVVDNLNSQESTENTEKEDTENKKENKENKKENKKENNEEETIEKIEMILYSKDVNTEEKTIIEKINLDKSLSLDKKIEILAQELSKKAFNGLPINLIKIEERKEKKIALFNLDELDVNAGDITFDKYEGVNWINNYFAGSAGGGVTEFTLIETLLQREYSGEWIDGVEFTYKNSKIEFDHVPELGEISYR